MFKKLVLILLTQLIFYPSFSEVKPLKIGVIGLTHTHVHWIFNSQKRTEFTIVGIVEPNKALAKRYAEQYQFPMSSVYATIEELLLAKQPEAVTAFGNIYDHLQVVEICAPKGIHVMVEKPLAVNLEHARKMASLARKHKIHLITNYETTWYPSNHKAYDLVKRETIIGEIRKVVVRDGHRGPKKIGINKEFLDWLTDPKLNGGGAITDFGCYGANLLTWLMDGRKPKKVTAITQQFQPENNPKVDDESIIILEYEKSVAIIQASWNWPIGRKDMEIYGLKGVVFADNRHQLRIRMAKGYDGFSEEKMVLEERASPYDDPFVYLAAIVNGSIKMNPLDLSSLENSLVVIEILDAAKRSAATNQSVFLK